MSFAGLSAFANTSIARTPEPSATVNGPFGVSQPASCGGSDPLRGVVVGAGAWAARALGADLDGVRRAAPLLTDAELRDLATRSASPQADPAAGVSDNDLRWALYIFLIVAIVILVIKAVD